MTPDELIAFESDIATEFNAGKITAPVHLYSGGAEALIDLCRGIGTQDWVLCSWRSHWQCLLKGVPAEEVKAEIMAGRSIALNFPKYRVVSSAIVGGVLPLAVGLGMSIQRRGGNERVFVFSGDMTSETGIFHESLKYVTNFDLPVTFVVEDNDQSVCTSTRVAWGSKTIEAEVTDNPHVRYFRYQTGKYPHAGSGRRIQF
jgi:TPP-dependent pyruvate/acetoin dehydrogenase alpha subunit